MSTGTHALRFYVEHHPDGGEAYTVARFAHKGDAIDYVKKTVNRPSNDIREMTAWSGRPRSKRSKLLCRGGWLVEMDRPGTRFLVLS